MPLALLTTLASSSAVAAAARAEVNVHGSVEEVHELEATLRSLFPPEAELSVNSVDAVDGGQIMRQPFTPSADDVVARAWIELHDGAIVTIYVADVSGERLLVRHLPRNDTDGELVKEATARIVATALEALLSGAQIGVERAKLSEAAAPAPVPTPKAPTPAPPAPVVASPSTLALTLGAHYGLELFSKQQALIHGPGLILGTSYRALPTRLGALLVGQAWLPSSTEGAVASVRVYSGALRLLATFEHDLGAAWAFHAGLGGGFDLTRVEPTARSTGVQVRLSAPKTLTTPALRASLGAKLRPASGFALYTMLALDADPSRTRYVSLNDGVSSRVLQPYALRPSLVLGVAMP